MIRRLLFLLVPILGIIGCFILDMPFLEQADYDRDLFRYMGYETLKGQIPYKDFFDHKPPLIYFIYALAHVLGSHGLFLLYSIVAISAAVCWWQLTRPLGHLYQAFIVAIYLLLMHLPHFSVGLGMTRGFSTHFLVIAYYCLTLQKNLSYFMCGLMLSMVFWTQQDQLMIFFPIFVYWILQGKYLLERWQVIGFTALGFMLLSVVIIVYFFIHDALSEMWKCAFEFNLGWYTSGGGYHFIMGSSLFYSIVVFLLMLCFISIPWIKSQPLKGISYWLSCLLCPISYYLSNRDIWYHFVPLAFGITLILIEVALFYRREGKPTWKFSLIGIYFIILVIIKPLVPQAANRWYIRPKIEQYLQFNKVEEAHSYALFIFQDSYLAHWYLKYNKTCPSYWIYHHFWFWYPNWDQDGRELIAMISDLDAKRTKWIVDDHGKRALTMQQQHLQLWRNYLSTNYHCVINEDGVKLWEHN